MNYIECNRNICNIKAVGECFLYYLIINIKIQSLNDYIINIKNEIFYAANNILQDKHLAEDAVHQTFIKIYDILYKIDENNCRKTRNFLVIICRNISIDMYNQRKNRSEDEYNESVIIPNNESVAELIINNESFERLNEIIKELKPIYQEVILLRYSQDLSIEEISKLQKVNTKAVQKRIERAKKQLFIGIMENPAIK